MLFKNLIEPRSVTEISWSYNDICIQPTVTNHHKQFNTSTLLNGIISKVDGYGMIRIQILQVSLHLEKGTVWCGLYVGGIIGPYFFKTFKTKSAITFLQNMDDIDPNEILIN